MTRPVATTRLPFSYEQDLLRYLRLVVEPLCPARDDGVSRAWGRSVASACDTAPTSEQATGGVVVTLRPQLVAGPQGTPVSSRAVLSGIQEHLVELGLVGELRSDHGLFISSGTSGMSPALLERFLWTLPVTVRLDDEPDALAPVGTGPFYVERLWCALESELVACRGDPPPRPAIETGWVADELVLRRRGWSVFGARSVRFVGLKLPDDQARLLELAQALDSALADGTLHALVSVEADLDRALDAAAATRPGDASGSWTRVERASARTLVAALRPRDDDHWFPARCRGPVLAALGAVRDDPSFIASLAARPAWQLLPEPFELVHRWAPPVESPEGAAVAEPCSLVLLTNLSWRAVADQIATRSRALGVDFTVRAIEPKRELPERMAGRFGVSLLSIVALPHDPAYWLWDTTASSGWANDMQKEAARELAEAGHFSSAELDALQRQLDPTMVPLAHPRSWQAQGPRLLGLEASTFSLDPDRVALVPRVDPTLAAGSVLISALAALFTAGVSQRALSLARRRDRLERALRQWRHDLLAPLSVIQAWGESHPDSEAAVAIVAEAEHARAVIDQARFLVPGQAPNRDQVVTDLDKQVVQPAIAGVLRWASYEVPGVVPDLKAERVPHHPPLAIAPVELSLVLRNLLMNAWAYRGASGARIMIRAWAEGTRLIIEVEDHGLGLRESERERIFEQGVRGSSADGTRGSGLGLWLARTMLAGVGGALWLERARQPTIFRVAVPLSVDPHPPDGVSTKRSP